MSVDLEQDASDEFRERLLRRQQLANHLVDDILRRKEIEEEVRHDVTNDASDCRATTAHALEQCIDALHRFNKNFRIRDDVSRWLRLIGRLLLMTRF